MPFLLVLIGAVVLISAIRNTQGTLGTALSQDVPGFGRWALALGLVAALGFVPGLQRLSRWLLALVVVVLVLRNYQQFLTGITSLETSPPQPAQAVTSPAAAYVASPAAPNITAAEVSGTGTTPGLTAALAAALENPATFNAAIEAGVGGFGGVA